MSPVWILISLRQEPTHLSFMASTNAVLATVCLLVTYSVCVCVCVYVWGSLCYYNISHKTDVHEGCKNFSNAAETTGDRIWSQNPKDTEKATLTKLQCILTTTVVTQTQQTCTKPLTEISMLVSDWWIRLCRRAPHSTHKAQRIHTSHMYYTFVSHKCY